MSGHISSPIPQLPKPWRRARRPSRLSTLSVRRLEFFGIVFSPTFRLCLAVGMLLFYIVQVITHANNIQEYNVEHNSTSDTPTRLESSYLAIDVFLMLMAMIQIFWAWSDYQSFELVLLQTNDNRSNSDNSSSSSSSITLGFLRRVETCLF